MQARGRCFIHLLLLGGCAHRLNSMILDAEVNCFQDIKKYPCDALEYLPKTQPPWDLPRLHRRSAQFSPELQTTVPSHEVVVTGVRSMIRPPVDSGVGK